MENINFNDIDLFARLTSEDSLAILLFLLGAYLLGFLTGWVARGRKVRTLKKEVKAKETALQEQQSKLDELHSEMQKKEEDLKKVKLDLDDAYTRHQVLETDKRQLEIDRDTIIDDHRKLKTSNQAYADTIEDLQAQVANMREQERQLVAQLQQTKNNSGDVAQLQQLYNATLNKLGTLEEKVNRLEMDNTSLRSGLKQDKNLAPDSFDEQNILARLSDKAILSQRIEPSPELLKNDLTLINGIGPFIEKKLNSIGIGTYADIASWSDADIERVTKDIQFFPGRIKQDNWVGQAEALQKKAKTPQDILQESLGENDPKNLKIIEGIGPKTEAVLKEGGIRNWVELANADVEQLKAILKAQGTPYDMLNPSTWPEQARLAANAEWDRLKQYQDYLIGGIE